MKKRFTKTSITNLLYIIFCPIATFYLLEWYTHNPWTTMKVPIQILNIVFFELVLAFLFFLFKRLRIALMVETSFFLIVGLANYFVLQFRSAPIMPWDLFSLGTAISVAGNYSYHLDKTAIIVLIGFILLLIIEWRCKFKLNSNWKIRIAFGLLFFLLIWGYGLMLHQDSIILKFKLYDKLFTPTVMTKRDGTAVAFIMELKYMSVSKPNGYNDKEAVEILSSYSTKDETKEATGRTPNIIVIMDEAFSDPNVLGDFKTNIDYMPFIHTLMDGAEDTVSGQLNVSILGGNTPNTEFEYLTGNTMAFLPQGSIPFQQYINKELPSMASHLQGLGYSTIAMHPYYSTGWDRNTVYPLLGFQDSYFLDDFDEAEHVRNYVSDQSSFDKIIDCYEKKEEGKPLFLFNVTMQNHSSYSEEFDNFTPSVTVEDTASKILPNYLSLLKLTDDAFGNLVNYFKSQEEDTIIVFFGDHQPTNSVIEPIWKMQGKSSDSLTDAEEALRYQVPYVIWANYDIEEAKDLYTSANYLGAETLSIAGLPLPDYFSYLQETKETYPIITSIQVTDSTGNSTTVKERKKDLSLYEKLQYYQLFGSQKK